MKRLCLALVVVTLAGCTQQPASGIKSAFRSLLRSVERGDSAEVERIAPFLSTLAAAQKDAVFASLRSLAASHLDLAVSRGQADAWVLRVSRKGAPPLLVPFTRGAGGRWQMSAVLEQTRHIDVIPARK